MKKIKVTLKEFGNNSLDKGCLIITLTFSSIEIQSLYQNLVFDNIQISCKIRSLVKLDVSF